MRTFRWAVLMGAVVWLIAPTALPADANPMPDFPWLREGTELVSLTHVAEIPGHEFTLREDGRGDWIDPSSGLTYDKNYSVQDTVLDEITVVALDGKIAALADADWGLEQQLGFPDPVMLAPNMPLVVDVNTNDYWCLPRDLAAAQTDADKGILVSRCQWQSGKKTFDAVRIQILTKTVYQVKYFDLKSGLCLHTSLEKVDDKGNTQIDRIDVFDLRHLNVPWANEPTPPAIVNGTSFHFEGRIKKLGTAVYVAPQSAVVDFVPKDHGQRWFSYDAHRLLNGGDVGTVPFLFGPGEFCGLWIGSESINSLQAGQVLDDDPDTKMKTVVAKVSDKGVEITCSNSSSFRAYDYERAGGTEIGWEEYNKPNQNDQIMLRK